MNFFLFCFVAVPAVIFAEEACYSYAGGHVYPQETTKSTVGQNLVTSKAQNADIEIFKDSEDMFLGIFFQTPMMKKTMDAFPEFLALDGTYKLLDINVPVFIFLIEDGHCRSEIVAVALLCYEDKRSLDWMVRVFKERNPSSSSIKSIMTDKDLTERGVLKEHFPSARLLLCVFHTLRTLNREISCEKLGISQSQRLHCLGILQQMVYAQCEDKFKECLENLESIAPKQVLNYYHKNWHNIKDEWHLGQEYHSVNFLNSTNNRVENINSKLKSVISKHSTFQEFLEKLFCILNTLQNEREHAAVMSLLKRPIATDTIGTPEYHYSNLLTKPVAKYVRNQLELSKKIITCPEEKNGKFLMIDPVQGQLELNENSCSCNFHSSMLLPCKHIFALRKSMNLPEFEKSLCNERWTNEYTSYIQNGLSNSSTQEDSTEQPIKITVGRLLKPKTVGDKRKSALIVTNRLADSLCVMNTQTFEKRLKILKHLQSLWDADVDVSIGPLHSDLSNACPTEEVSDADQVNMPNALSIISTDRVISTDESLLIAPTEDDTNMYPFFNADVTQFTSHLLAVPSTSSLVEENATSNFNLETVPTEDLSSPPNIQNLPDHAYAELSGIKMPKILKRKGRPKGHDLTVIGIPRKKKTEKKPKPFILMPFEQKQNILLKWWLGDDDAEKIARQNFIFHKDAVKNKEESVPIQFLDAIVDVRIIKRYFTSDGFNMLNSIIEDRKKNTVWECDACSDELEKNPSILCDSCLRWYHKHCVGINTNKTPKSQYWFCRTCYYAHETAVKT